MKVLRKAVTLFISAFPRNFALQLPNPAVPVIPAPSCPHTTKSIKSPNPVSLKAFSNQVADTAPGQALHVFLAHQFCTKIWENIFILKETRLNYGVKYQLHIYKNDVIPDLSCRGASLFWNPHLSLHWSSRTLVQKRLSSAGSAPGLALGLFADGLRGSPEVSPSC